MFHLIIQSEKDMIKIFKPLLMATLALFMAGAVFAGNSQQAASAAQEARTQVISQYLDDLRTANAPSIGQLFVPNGTVVSTSQGKVDARTFFNSFLPAIQTATVGDAQIYVSMDNNDRYTARFHFAWTMKDGGSGSGVFADEFIFAKGTNKLLEVTMFENVYLK